MATTTQQPPRTTPRKTIHVLDVGVQGLGFVWVFVGFFYFVDTDQMDPSSVKFWLVVLMVLSVAHIVLSVLARRKR
jgi:hypothetical protein